MSSPLLPSFFPFSYLYPSLPSLFPSSTLFIYLSLKYLLSTYCAGRKCRPTSKSLGPWIQALCFHPQWLRHGLRFSFLIGQKRTITDLPPRIVEGLYDLLHIKYFALPLALPKCSPNVIIVIKITQDVGSVAKQFRFKPWLLPTSNVTLGK